MTPAEFRQARVKLGLTQSQLAPLLGYGRGLRISEIERGAHEPSAAAARLLRLYVVLQERAPELLPEDWPRGEK